MQARPALRTAVGAPGPVLRGLFRVAEAQSSRGGAEAATPLAAERNTRFQRAQHSVLEAASKNPFAAPLRSPESDPKGVDVPFGSLWSTQHEAGRPAAVGKRHRVSGSMELGSVHFPKLLSSVLVMP